MAVLRAIGYFLEEALVSLWRSRLVNALSVGTIAVSLFVLGAFLTVASNLNEVVARWSRKVQVTFQDGETLVGSTQGYQPDRPGFFMIPADPASNNERIYVVARAVQKVSFLS